MPNGYRQLNENCLPGLYPREGMPPHSPESEKKVYGAIADALPAGWYAWHSIKLRSQEGEDAEADFVISAAGSPASIPSILILEVKGGSISKKDGQWFQNGKLMRRVPRDQAIRSRVALLSKFKSHGITAPPIGEAVVFPDQDYEAPPTQGDLEGLVLGARELPYLKEFLPDLVRKAIPSHFYRSPGEGWIRMLHDLWCECWPSKLNLSFQARTRLQERVKLDDAQFKILSTAKENDLVLVHGRAGTGKTLIAIELARKEAESGNKVLVLTFTEALGFELAKELPSPNITVSSIGRFALERLRKKGFDKPEKPEPEFWDGITKRAAKSKSLWKACAWDTVIIDEAQDFGRYEWGIASRCAGKNRMWVFMDESQAFWEKRRVPSSLINKCTRLSLEEPYRCPHGIQALAEAYLGKAVNYAPIELGLNDGTIGIVISEREEAHDDVGKEINRLLEEGFKPHDIAVLSLRGRMFIQNIMHRKELGGHLIVQATDDRAKDHIVCDTFLRYKGLERLAVIVTDISSISSKYCVRMNIAISRAVGILRIVGTKAEIEKDEILNRLSYSAKNNP